MSKQSTPGRKGDGSNQGRHEADQEQERPEDVRVTLEPVLGVPPTTYVPVIYGLLILVIFFLVLVLPGIRHHGTELTVVTVPARASLRVDGERVGTTPGTYFVPSGARVLEVTHPGFAPYREERAIPGRVVGSWLFPRRETVVVRLQEGDADALLAAATREFASWSMTGEASGQYQFPPIARALAEDLRAAAAQEAWGRFLDASLAQVASEALMNDLAAGALSLGGESEVAVPAGISGVLQDLARASDRAPLFPLQIANSMSAEREPLVARSAWVEAAAGAARELSSLAFDGSAVLAGSVGGFALGLEFVSLPGGRVVLGGTERAARGGDVPYRAELSPFRIAATELPFSAFQAFLEAEPQWAPQNAASLREEGLVDEAYLANLDELEENPALPVTGISYHAAQAFARWYTTLLPAGLEARLPTEAEWEFARRVSGQDAGIFADAGRTGPVPVDAAGDGRSGLTGFSGNVWEWTADWFAPYGPVHGSGAATLPAAQRVVRGGGWATDEVGFTAGDRGSMDPAWCSPFVGLRLVISSTAP